MNSFLCNCLLMLPILYSPKRLNAPVFLKAFPSDHPAGSPLCTRSSSSPLPPGKSRSRASRSESCSSGTSRHTGSGLPAPLLDAWRGNRTPSPPARTGFIGLHSSRTFREAPAERTRRIRASRTTAMSFCKCRPRGASSRPSVLRRAYGTASACPRPSGLPCS